jgi:flagellar hook assembly protein FlgD
VNNPSTISLKIYDVAGKLIKTLIDDELTPNRYSLIWDGTDETGTQMPSGIYFYTLKLDEYEQTKQMILVK